MAAAGLEEGVIDPNTAPTAAAASRSAITSSAAGAGRTRRTIDSAPGDRPVVRRVLLPGRPATRRSTPSRSTRAASASGAPTGIRLEHEKAGIDSRHAVEAAAVQAAVVRGRDLSARSDRATSPSTPLQMAQVVGHDRQRWHTLPAALREACRCARRHPATGGRARGDRRRADHQGQHGEEGPRGDARRGDDAGRDRHAARIRAVEVAGKTGTSQVVRAEDARLEPRARGSRDHAWFIAFAPVEAPDDRDRRARRARRRRRRQVAAPIAKQVLEHYFTRDAGPPLHDKGDDGDEPRTRHRRPHAPRHRRGGVQEAHAARD